MNDHQLITPLLTDEEAKAMAQRTEILLCAFTVPLVIILFVLAWVAVPA